MPTYHARVAGIYRARFLGTTSKDLTNKDTGEAEPRWLWRFQEVADPTTAGEIGQFTGTSLASPNSNAYKMASGIVGRKLVPGDNTDDHIGALVDVIYGPNQAGNLAVTGIVRVPEADAVDPPQAAVPQPPAASADPTVSEDDQLPF